MGIYVWGTGCGASEFIEKGFALNEITAFVDSFPSSGSFLGKPVLYPQQVPVADCTLLIITARHAEEILQKALSVGIPAERMLFLKNSYILSDRNEASIAKQILSEELLQRLITSQRIVTVPSYLRDSRLPKRDLDNDYIRLSTLELLCRRVQNVSGACAELGVYKGYFARCINQLLPERTLYLFDSFSGFLDETGAKDSFQAAHKNTSVGQVLKNMPNAEKVIVKPGFFPDSLGGLEDTFSLVSLDVDFYEATLEGLRYFWPRLNPGGYIMLHDWGSEDLPGVRSALTDYENEINLRIPSVPLCDVGGSLILCK